MSIDEDFPGMDQTDVLGDHMDQTDPYDHEMTPAASAYIAHVVHKVWQDKDEPIDHLDCLWMNLDEKSREQTRELDGATSLLSVAVGMRLDVERLWSAKMGDSQARAKLYNLNLGQPHRLLSLDVLGNPMREHNGKWETAVWPSSKPEITDDELNNALAAFNEVVSPGLRLNSLTHRTALLAALMTLR